MPVSQQVQDQSPRRAGRGLRTIVIEPFRQIKFGLYMIALCSAFIIASGGLFLRTFQEQYKDVMGIFNIVDPSAKWDIILNEVFYSNALRLVIFYTIFMCVLMAVIFRLTHRYYGPLVSIERFISEIAQGNYSSRVTIRSKDELQNLVVKLNDLADILEKRHGSHQVHDKSDRAS